MRQTELISHIESMLFSRLLHFLPLQVLAALHHKALVVPHGYSWSLTIRPNDLREDRLPRDITESVHWLVSTRHHSHKRRPFSRYTTGQHRTNCIYRKKSLSFIDDSSGCDFFNDSSKAIEEKLDMVSDLKVQLKCMIDDSNEVKLNQEEMNTSMAVLMHQVLLLGDVLENLPGGDKTEVLQRCTRLSKDSFRHPLRTDMVLTMPPTSRENLQPMQSFTHQQQQAPLEEFTKPKHKASLDGVVKRLASRAVSTSADNVNNSGNSATAAVQRGGQVTSVDRSTAQQQQLTLNLPLENRPRQDRENWQGSGSSLSERMAINQKKKLRRTNLMKRRESQV